MHWITPIEVRKVLDQVDSKEIKYRLICATLIIVSFFSFISFMKYLEYQEAIKKIEFKIDNRNN